MAKDRVKPIPKPSKPRHYVREWRQYRNLTQEQLAERIGKTHGAISQLERGLTDYTQGMLEALAYALSCEPSDLLGINPLVEGKVVDISVLLRGAPPAVLNQVYSVVGAILHTGTGPLAFSRQDTDFEFNERPQEVGRSMGKERPLNRQK